MIQFAQSALDFARECLGWEGANSEHSPDGVIWNGKSRERMAGFHFTDLNAIVAAVKQWCDANHRNIEVYYVPAPTNLWYVSVGDDPFKSADLCQAMLAACVEAARKMKAGP